MCISGSYHFLNNITIITICSIPKFSLHTWGHTNKMTWFRRRLDNKTKHQPPCDQSNGGQHLWSRDNHFLTNATKYPNKNWLFNRLNNYFVSSLQREDKKDWKVHYSLEIHWMDCVFSVTLIHKIRCMMNFSIRFFDDFYCILGFLYRAWPAFNTVFTKITSKELWQR